MTTLEDQTASWLAQMVFTGLFLTPLLALLKVLTPLPLPWLGVFIPWIGVFHLLLCWFAARLIVRVLWDLVHLSF
jgi:hypothetical protein